MPSPTMSSLNNGVVICINCAEFHKSFGSSISFVKSLTNENWTDDEVMYIQIAGNKRFFALMSEYNIQTGQSIDYKYSIIAADYYRKLV